MSTCVVFYFFGKKLIICIHYNLQLLHFPITKNLGVCYILICLLIFSLINEYFLKGGIDIYWFVFFFFSFFWWLSSFTHYFSVCVLSGALSSSYYFCLFFFLTFKPYSLFFCIFLGWHINNLVRLHRRHIGWIQVSEVIVNLSNSC